MAASKAEWVALMVVLANQDRAKYREWRAEAWDLVVKNGRSEIPSKRS